MFLKQFSLLIALLFTSAFAFAKPSADFILGSDTPLENPHDIKLSPNGNYLFVADVGNNRVVILDPKTLELISTFGSDHQDGTHDIDFDKQGNAYVADTHNGRVTIYKMSGTNAQLIGELNEKISGPEGVLVHPNGNIYVAGAWSNNLVSYKDGKVIKEMTGLSKPHDIELAPNGNMWLSDSGNNRMLLLSPELKILKEWQGSPFDFNGVRYQDVLANGTVIAADKNNHQVKVFDQNGKPLLTLGAKLAGKGVNKFRTPEGIEVRGNVLWIADSGNNRIVKYQLNLD